jgi:hypothetical protein
MLLCSKAIWQYANGLLRLQLTWKCSNDRDLLDLEKPFGVQIITPVQLLLHIRGKTGL